MEVMLFDGWRPILRTLLVGVLSYSALVAMLRMTGKRTLSKLNAFDLVVTVALGSTMATVLTSRDVALAQGIVAFAVLIGLQYAITWTSVRSRRVRTLVKSEPRMLARRGEMLPDAMRRERVTEDELRAAMREAGMDDLARVEVVVLETDGSLSVVERDVGPRAVSS
ncbi:DUF421 domain-containing protein [Roseisolibacter sp. H3M3-2]|nr:YetF domain-containing protein [Roseisolibacter sp. H3M3-2]MDF1501340.1 DUF421 domain-containing protein [Roseisolibacter sp. H3M3-2]